LAWLPGVEFIAELKLACTLFPDKEHYVCREKLYCVIDAIRLGDSANGRCVDSA